MDAMSATTLPPSPRMPPLLQTLLFVVAPGPFLSQIRRRYGDVVTFRTGGYTFVMVSDPAAIKEVFTGSPHMLYAGEANRLLGPALGRRSVLLLDGDEHLRHRRLMLPPFHGRRMRTYERLMSSAADRAVDSWPVGEPFPILPSMQTLTLEVIMEAVFGVGDQPRHAELRRRIREMLRPISTRFGVLVLALSGGRLRDRGALKRFNDRKAAVNELMYAEIAARRADPDLEERDDVFSMLLAARDEDGGALTDEEVRDELMTLLIAGHETTATALAWSFERLLRAPGVLAQARREIEAGEDDSYIDAIVKETLRLRPIIPSVGRILQETFEVAGYTLPAGIEVSPAIALTHSREDLYPDAKAFRPERFLGEGAPDTYSWLPYGGGPRRCLGAAFASFEMRVVLRTVLERAELEPVGPAERLSRRGITIVPSRGARVRQPRAPRPAASPRAVVTGTV